MEVCCPLGNNIDDDHGHTLLQVSRTFDGEGATVTRPVLVRRADQLDGRPQLRIGNSNSILARRSWECLPGAPPHHPPLVTLHLAASLSSSPFEGRRKVLHRELLEPTHRRRHVAILSPHEGNRALTDWFCDVQPRHLRPR